LLDMNERFPMSRATLTHTVVAFAMGFPVFAGNLQATVRGAVPVSMSPSA